MRVTFIPYFNEAAGPATRKGADALAASDPDWRNRPHPEHIPYMDGFRQGDPLVASELYFTYERREQVIERELPRMCELVFHAMNRDNRRNGSRERSLSVGDVLVAHVQGGGKPRSFAVDNGGFYELDVLPWHAEEMLA